MAKFIAVAAVRNGNIEPLVLNLSNVQEVTPTPSYDACEIRTTSSGVIDVAESWEWLIAKLSLSKTAAYVDDSSVSEAFPYLKQPHSTR